MDATVSLRLCVHFPLSCKDAYVFILVLQLLNFHATVHRLTTNLANIGKQFCHKLVNHGSWVRLRRRLAFVHPLQTFSICDGDIHLVSENLIHILAVLMVLATPRCLQVPGQLRYVGSPAQGCFYICK